MLARLINLAKVILNYSGSIKEKVSSSAIRALGFLLADVDIDFLCSDVFGTVNLAEKKKIYLCFKISINISLMKKISLNTCIQSKKF